MNLQAKVSHLEEEKEAAKNEVVQYINVFWDVVSSLLLMNSK